MLVIDNVSKAEVAFKNIRIKNLKENIYITSDEFYECVSNNNHSYILKKIHDNNPNFMYDIGLLYTVINIYEKLIDSDFIFLYEFYIFLKRNPLDRYFYVPNTIKNWNFLRLILFKSSQERKKWPAFFYQIVFFCKISHFCKILNLFT